MAWKKTAAIKSNSVEHLQTEFYYLTTDFAAFVALQNISDGHNGIRNRVRLLATGALEAVIYHESSEHCMTHYYS